MDIFQSVLGTDVSMGVKLVIVTFILVVVLLLIFWIIRKITSNGILKTPRGRQPRLAVTDAASMDEKRRLVLVRRDNVEHLVMIGGATDVLIESNIIRNQPVINPASRSQPAQSSPAPTKPSQTTNAQQQPPADRADNPVDSQAPIIKTAAALAASAVASKAVADTTEPNPQSGASNSPMPAPETSTAPAEEKIPNDDMAKSAPISSEDIAVSTKSAPAQPDADVEIPVHTPKEITSEIAGFAPDEKPERTEKTEDKSNEPEMDGDELSQSAIANLEDALGNELDPADDVKGSETNEEATSSKDKEAKPKSPEKEPEDEMQKLLNELAGEKT